MRSYIISFFLMCAAAMGQVLFTNQIAYTSHSQEFVDCNISGVFTNITISAWVKDFVPRYSGEPGAIIGSARPAPTPARYIQLMIQSNYVSAIIAGGGSPIYETKLNVNIGSELTFVCFVRDGSNTAIYCNGFVTNKYEYNYATIEAYAGLPMFVGARNTGLPYNGINACLQDVRFYTRTLSASEISEIYHHPWSLADDPALVLRTCVVTNDTGTALTGVARNYGTGADGTYSNSPTVARPHVQHEKPLTMELP